MREGKNRDVIMRVGKYSCNFQTSEGRESTLLVAFLQGPFVPQTYH